MGELEKIPLSHLSFLSSSAAEQNEFGFTFYREHRAQSGRVLCPTRELDPPRGLDNNR